MDADGLIPTATLTTNTAWAVLDALAAETPESSLTRVAADAVEAETLIDAEPV